MFRGVNVWWFAIGGAALLREAVGIVLPFVRVCSTELNWCSVGWMTHWLTVCCVCGFPKYCLDCNEVV